MVAGLIEERQQFMRLLCRIVEIPSITHHFSDCRNPKANKSLDLAISGPASVIVTGDNELLALHSFHQVSIVTPADYLEWART